MYLESLCFTFSCVDKVDFYGLSSWKEHRTDSKRPPLDDEEQREMPVISDNRYRRRIN